MPKPRKSLISSGGDTAGGFGRDLARAAHVGEPAFGTARCLNEHIARKATEIL